MLLISTVYFIYIGTTYAQPVLPQRTITVVATQPIDFGMFVVTGNGTITVNYDGTRSATGGVIVLPSSTVQPAIFDIKLCQGREVTIIYDPFVYINGDNGGSLKLNVGDTEKGPSGSQFPVNNNCNFITTLRVGGTLEVSGGSPIGIYTGSFSIDFTQQ